MPTQENWPINILLQAILNIFQDIDRNNKLIRSKLKQQSQKLNFQNEQFETEKTRDRLMNEKDILLLKNEYELKIQILDKQARHYLEIIENYKNSVLNDKSAEKEAIIKISKRLQEKSKDNLLLNKVCQNVQEKFEQYKEKTKHAISKNDTYLAENKILKSQITNLLAEKEAANKAANINKAQTDEEIVDFIGGLSSRSSRPSSARSGSSMSDLVEVFDRATETLKFEPKSEIKETAKNREHEMNHNEPITTRKSLKQEIKIKSYGPPISKSITEMLQNRKLHQATFYQTGSEVRLGHHNAVKSENRSRIIPTNAANTTNKCHTLPLDKNTVLGGMKMPHVKEAKTPSKMYNLNYMDYSNYDYNVSIPKLSNNRLRSSVRASNIVCPRVVEMDINRNYHSSKKFLK